MKLSNYREYEEVEVNGKCVHCGYEGKTRVRLTKATGGAERCGYCHWPKDTFHWVREEKENAK